MSDKTKSVIAAGWISAAAAAFIIGSLVRDRIDLATPNRGAKLDNLVASRDNFMGGRAQTEIPAGDFFYELTEKLKKEYYEQISDDQKLASGAVRGMIGYLGDTESTFMDKDQFATYLNERQGKYEGIGADMEVLLVPASGTVVAAKPANRAKVIDGGQFGRDRAVAVPAPQPPPADAEEARDRAMAPSSATATAFPRLTVVSIVPGGPADRAGVRAGDIVYSVDDHWVINADLAVRFTKAEVAFKNHKIGWPELNAVRKEVRDKYEHMMLPLRAKDRLITGASGNVKVVWDRGAERRTTTISRAPCSMPGFRADGDHILLPFIPGSPEEFRRAITGKSSVTIDLRNNTMGDFGVMRQCIAAVAPSGNYGYEMNDRGGKAVPFAVTQGNSNPPKLTLITDRSTRGAAEIFALALSSRGYAKIEGNDAGGAREFYEIVQLPDRTGYTLVTARYHPRLDVKVRPAAKTGRVAATGGRH